jgi:hypothetical protein
MRGIAIAAWGALLCLAVPARAEILVTISKAQQQLVVAVDGQETYRWPVSTGKPGDDTPSGHFTAFRLEQVYFSKKYDDAPMPNAVFFHDGYAVHGTMEESRLGRPVSHGCVRLSRANAETLFALVSARGMHNTRFVVSDAPLMTTRLPDPAAMAKTGVAAAALPPKQELAARTSERDPPAEQLDRADASIKQNDFRAVMPARAPKARREARAVQRSTSRADDTARRGDREAGLRAVYRKYGFTW